MTDFIFGYGSLICANSRSRTGVSGDAIPVTVLGIKRGWYVSVPVARHTAVGAIEDSSAQCNGVIFPVDAENLPRFDEREQGYRRVPLAKSQINSDQQIPANATIWTYVGRKTSSPSEQYPITQSYLDVILRGCFSWSEEFAVQFIQTTSHWGDLINDRSHPRYPRAIESDHHHHQYDLFLKQHLPELLKNRKNS